MYFIFTFISDTTIANYNRIIHIQFAIVTALFFHFSATRDYTVVSWSIFLYQFLYITYIYVSYVVDM